jgi:hypothetical protein
MRLLLLLLGAVCAYSQTVSNISFTDVSHSSALMHFDVSSPWTNVRIRWVRASDGSCTSGTGGTIIPTGYPNENLKNFRPVDGPDSPQFQIIVQGLPFANTDYNICPEVANTGGGDINGTASYSSGVSALLHTTALPAQHPALPVDPVIYKPTFPDTTNYHKVFLDANCFVTSGGTVGQILGEALTDAANHQAEYGTIILGVPGSRCQQYAQFNTSSQNVTRFNGNQASSTDNSITFTAAQIIQIMSPGSGTLDEGMGLRFGQNADITPQQLPGRGGLSGDWPTLENPVNCTGIAPGVVYYVHLPNPANHTKIQLTCNAPFGQTMADGTASKLMVFASAAFGDFLEVQKSPSGLNWIILDADLPDTGFAAPGTRVGPEWTPKMPALLLNFMKGRYNGSFVGNTPPTSSQSFLLNTGANDGNLGRMISNLWIRRWMFSTIDDLDSRTSTDPNVYQFMFASSPYVSDLVLDQVYFHGLGGPHRVHRAIASLDGHNVALMNSRMDNMEIFISDYHGLQVSQLSPTSFKIGKGYHGLNASGKFVLANDVTVTMSPGANTGDIFVSADLDQTTLNISLPPGVTGTCAPAVCNIFTSQLTGNGALRLGSHGFPNTVGGSPIYWVDPRYSSTASGATVGLLDKTPNPSQADTTASPSFFSGAAEVGTKFIARANGFLPQIRFYKPSQDVNTSHTVTLWNSAGTAIASVVTSGESASGWQTANFASAPALVNGQTYVASYFTNVGVLYADNWYRNQNTVNGNMEAVGNYSSIGGGCYNKTAWPQNWAGNTRVGVIACGWFNAGSLDYLENADARHTIKDDDGFRDAQNGVQDQSGANAIIAGKGPGPWYVYNNYFSFTGNGFHFDEGGINTDHTSYRTSTQFFTRGDYFIKRNTFNVPLSHMAGQPPNDFSANETIGRGNRKTQYDQEGYDATLFSLSNGAYYECRQPLEFKSGHRVRIEGNLFDGMYNNTASSIFIALTSVVDEGIKDVNILNNTFQHGPGGVVVSSTQGGSMQTAPVTRFNFSNNLLWDIRSSYFAPGQAQNPGAGYVVQGLGHEDATISHNTVFFNKGRAPAITIALNSVEGVKITDNIFFLTGGNGGFGVRGDGSVFASGTGPDPCASRADGLARAGCVFVGNDSQVARNLFLSDTLTLSSVWNDGKNYIPSNPTDATAVQFYDLSTAWNASYATQFYPPATPFATPNFRLRAGSPIASGATNRASDGRSVGANIEALEVAQGKVTLNGVPNSSLTRSSATVSFVAPDSDSCSVDWRVLDDVNDPNLTQSFTRVLDTTVKGRTHNVNLTGLPAGSTIKYRVNCQVQQPLGQFRTKT